MCSERHFFHRDCATKFILNAPYDHRNPNFKSPTLVLKCPHCGGDAPNNEEFVKMKCQNVPVFSPSQQHFKQSAKMNFIQSKTKQQSTKSNIKNAIFLLDIEKLIPDSIVNLLLETQRQHILSTTTYEYTTKNMFYAIHENNVERVAKILGKFNKIYII